MAETSAMPPSPKMAKDASDENPMPMSQAMDLLDSHGIDESNWKDVSGAIEAVYGEDEAPGQASDDVAPSSDAEMMRGMFSSGRKRGAT